MLTVWWGAGPRGGRGRGAAAGLALFVPDVGRAGQADGLAPGSEPLVLLGEGSRLVNPSVEGGGDHPAKRSFAR